MKSTKVLMLIMSVVVAEHHTHHHHMPHQHSHLADIIKPSENFFSKTIQNVQTIMNIIFDSMKLAEQFPHKPKVKSLMTMYYDLNNIVVKYLEGYEVLVNATAVDFYNKTIKQIRLDQLVREIFAEKQFNVYDIIKGNHHKHIPIEPNTKTSMSPFKDSREFKQFIRGFVGKVKSLTVEDLLRKEKRLPNVQNLARRNLKLWEPVLSEETNDFVRNRRLFNAKRTNIWKFPFIASIHILNEFTCAGSIVSSDLILTAASCMTTKNPMLVYVRIGSDWTSQRGSNVPVLEIHIYPAYDPETLKHNMAILRLEKTIKFEQSYRPKVRRIRLDDGFGNTPMNTDDIIILGWGAKAPNQIGLDYEKLSMATLEVYSYEECKYIYTKNYVTDNNFCAGFVSKGGGACSRDVGGPGVVDDTLVGVVSFGAPVCGAKNAPTVFTRVGPYMNWIKRVMDMDTVRRTTRKPQRNNPYYYEGFSPQTVSNFKPAVYFTTENTPVYPDKSMLKKILTKIEHKNDTLIHDIINNRFGSYYTFKENMRNNDHSTVDIPVLVPRGHNGPQDAQFYHFNLSTPRLAHKSSSSGLNLTETATPMSKLIFDLIHQLHEAEDTPDEYNEPRNTEKNNPNYYIYKPSQKERLFSQNEPTSEDFDATTDKKMLTEPVDTEKIYNIRPTVERSRYLKT